ncbi:MAG TPA: SRPBCC family protein [Nitrospiraceae bacterium]|nr:SRPBCC family protein [Nitrospiraceae bacterium]
MRSWAKRTGRCLAHAWLGALLWSVPAFAAATTDTDQLDVYADPAGGVRATAHITFPAKPDIVQSILTDYAKWPELFETNMRVAGLSIDQGIATIDLRIAHALLPGERRLVSESQTIAGGGLVTDLKEGDFKRYHRVWKLAPADNGGWTSAEFELVVEIDTIVPDWVVAIEMREVLRSHFRIVKEKALAQAQQELRSERSQ